MRRAALGRNFVANSVHQVCLADSGGAVEKKGIVDLPWGMCNRVGTTLGKPVAPARHESIEGVARVELWGIRVGCLSCRGTGLRARDSDSIGSGFGGSKRNPGTGDNNNLRF